jgi:hypothetical protein
LPGYDHPVPPGQQTSLKTVHKIEATPLERATIEDEDDDENSLPDEAFALSAPLQFVSEVGRTIVDGPATMIDRPTDETARTFVPT